jgi:hypothetical protein
MISIKGSKNALSLEISIPQEFLRLSSQITKPAVHEYVVEYTL